MAKLMAGSGASPDPAAYERLMARYRGVIDAAVDGVIIIDASGTIETFNPAAEKIFGYGADEVVGRNVSLLMPAPDAHRHDGYIARYIGGGAPRIIGAGREVTGRRRNGETFPLELAVGEVDDVEPRCFVGTVRDISRRRELELALNDREQQLTLLFDHAPIGIFSATVAGRFVRVNPALCSLVGYTETELAGRGCRDLTLPELHSELESALAQLAGGDKPECHCRLRWRHRDGSVMDVDLHAVLAGEDRRLVIGQVVDRTEQVRSERESDEARARLAQVGRVTTLGEMASAIAHEINQPLTAISAYAQALRRMLSGPAQNPELVGETLESIAGQALRAGDVVRRIRGFVRHRESGREVCDVNELVKTAIELEAFDLRHNDVLLESSLGGSLPPVLVDPVQIQQVCVNLIRNAVDAMRDVAPARRRLQLSTAASDDGVVIRCADAGPGIAPSMREHLFQPFQTSKAEGMGMGLSISRSIVDAHGGTLRHDHDGHDHAGNDAGGGAVFIVELPAATDT